MRSGMRLMRLICCAVGVAAALRPGGRITRAALLRSGLSALGATIPGAAVAYDLPPVEAYDNREIMAIYANKPNPPESQMAAKAFYAVTSNDLPTLKRMIASGWDLDAASDHTGKTTLHRAAQLGNTGAIEILLKAGVKVDPINTWKETLLHFAARNNNLPAVKQLVKAGADTNAKVFGGDTAADIAAKYRWEDVSEFFDAPAEK